MSAQDQLRQIIYGMKKPSGGGGGSFFGDPFSGESLDTSKWTVTRLDSGWTIDVNSSWLECQTVGGTGVTIAEVKSVDSFDVTDKTLEIELYSGVRSTGAASEGFYFGVLDASSKQAMIGWELAQIYAIATGMTTTSLNYAYQTDKVKIQHFSSNNSWKFWAHLSGSWTLVKDSGTLAVDASNVQLWFQCYEYHGIQSGQPTKWRNLVTDIPI